MHGENLNSVILISTTMVIGVIREKWGAVGSPRSPHPLLINARINLNNNNVVSTRDTESFLDPN
jgi:hypothetical protein